MGFVGGEDYVGRLAQLVERTLCIPMLNREVCVRSGFRASYRPMISFLVHFELHVIGSSFLRDHSG